LDTKLNFSTSCHLQTDGKTAVVDKSLSTILRALLEVNYRYWDEYLPHIEFSYNRVVHKTTKISPFEVVCGFNPLTPFDLILLPNIHESIHKDGVSKVEFFQKLHERVKNQIQEQSDRYAKQNNRGKRKLIFGEGCCNRGHNGTTDKNNLF